MKKVIKEGFACPDLFLSPVWQAPKKELRKEFRTRVFKTFSCSTQLRTKFQMLIKTKIPINKDVSCFKPLRYCIYHVNKY